MFKGNPPYNLIIMMINEFYIDVCIYVRRYL